jgi:hypothetical protein
VDRSYELRPLRIVSKGASDVADEDVETCGVHVTVRPERSVKLVLVHDLRPVSQQDGQQVERFPRQVNLGAGAKELTRLGVERERAESSLHGVRWR